MRQTVADQDPDANRARSCAFAFAYPCDTCRYVWVGRVCRMDMQLSTQLILVAACWMRRASPLSMLLSTHLTGPLR